MATEDERRLTFSFEACLDFFNTESVKKKVLSPGLKWQEQRMTPSKITEGLLYAGFMQLFFNSKKKGWKVLKKRWISNQWRCKT